MLEPAVISPLQLDDPKTQWPSARVDPCYEQPQPHFSRRGESISTVYAQLHADLKGVARDRQIMAAEDLAVHLPHLLAHQLQQLVPEFKRFLLIPLETDDDVLLCAAAARFFTPMAEAEAGGSVDFPGEEQNPDVMAIAPQGGWVAALLEWGAVPQLISLMRWPHQSETKPWPGSYAASGGRLLCALAAQENARAHELLLRADAVPVLLHALEEVWVNTCAAEILFFLAESPVPGTLDSLRMNDGAAILVAYITANVQNRRRRWRQYGPRAGEDPPFHEIACLYYAVQLLILLAVRPDDRDGEMSGEESPQLGLPVPTQDIVEAIEAIVGLRPPAKMMAVVQKLINCCPEASAVLQEKALNDQSKGGWLTQAWGFLKRALDDAPEQAAKSQKVV